MKRITAVIIIIGLLFSAYAGITKPSLDGRAKVADVGELPVGLFAKSASFLPGDTVIVTNPATKISIEVMIFGNIGSSEGIAIVLSPEAARELYITKGSNVIVQVTKKSDTYAESSILEKTLQTYQPEEVVEEEIAENEEPEFDTPSEAPEEDYYFYNDPDSIIKEEASELVIEEETEADGVLYVNAMDDAESEEIETETELEPVDEEIAFEEPEWPYEEVEGETELEPLDEEIAVLEPEWPSEEVEGEIEIEPENEEIAFEEPEWPSEEVEGDTELEPADEEIAFVEPEWPEEGEPVIEYVEIAEEPEISENFIEETETVLIPAEPNPPSYESIIQEEPEVVIIPIFEESAIIDDSAALAEETEEPVPVEMEPMIEPELTWADIPAIEDEVEVVSVSVSEPEPASDSAVTIPYGELTAGKWYIQIATCSKIESVENIINTYGKKYPIVVVKLDSGDMRVLIGSLTADEYPTILARFKNLGFKDAFARNK